MSESSVLRLDLNAAFDPEALEFGRELSSWLADHVPDAVSIEDEAGRFELRRSWQRTLFDAGWAGVSWPEEYGGRGAGPLQQFIYYEAMAWARAPEPVNQPGIILFGPALMVYGPDRLKEMYLRRMLSAEDIWCQGFSEPDAGSDLASIRTKATLIDDEFVVEGRKIWTSFAPYANKCALLCRTDAKQTRHAGLSMLILDLGQPGVEIGPIRQITGDENDFGQLFLDGAKVPRSHVAGEVGQGWEFAMKMLEFERSDLGLHNHARLETRVAVIAELLASTEARHAAEPAELSALHARLADVWTRCGLLRQFNLATAQRLAEGEPPNVSASMLRLYWSELAQLIGELEIDTAGADSEIGSEHIFEYLHSLHTTIASGTQEIQRNIVAQRILGLPREERQ
jgi:alkylation response protein AidB-like acyl-CoA dehydrogenase